MITETDPFLDNFVAIIVQTSGPPTRDLKMTEYLQICDIGEAEEQCVLKETQDSPLKPFPSYLPAASVRSWIEGCVTDEIIKNPLLENS